MALFAYTNAIAFHNINWHTTNLEPININKNNVLKLNRKCDKCQLCLKCNTQNITENQDEPNIFTQDGEVAIND